MWLFMVNCFIILSIIVLLDLPVFRGSHLSCPYQRSPLDAGLFHWKFRPSNGNLASRPLPPKKSAFQQGTCLCKHHTLTLPPAFLSLSSLMQGSCQGGMTIWRDAGEKPCRGDYRNSQGLMESDRQEDSHSHGQIQCHGPFSSGRGASVAVKGLHFHCRVDSD